MTPTIQVNESSVEVGVAEGSSVQDIIDLVQSQHVAHGEVIGSIYINGVFWRHDWDAELSALPAAEVTDLSLETMCPHDAASEGLEDLTEVLDLVEKQLGKSSDDLRFGNHARGLLLFAGAADMLTDAFRFVALYAEHHGLTDEHPGLVHAIQAEAAIGATLPAFEKAQANQDWSLVADIIEYDIGGEVGRIRKARQELESSASLHLSAGAA